MVKETWWFGPGSRIIITAQDRRLFGAHGINNIYEVNRPPTDEALQIFCMNAFGQKSPKDGFEELAWEVTNLAGKLPLGLSVMGSHFRERSKKEWTKLLPRLKTSLDAGIRSILMFSYDALDEEDKDLFLHIACYFNHENIEKVEEHLAKKFLEVRQRLNVLAEKSLISFIRGSRIDMHSLLVKLGREIVRKQSIREPGQRQFLVDRRQICEVLSGDATGSKNVIGIDFYYNGEEFDISQRAFEGMSNLQFLRIHGNCDTLQLSRRLNYLSRKLRLLHWSHFPMTCLPSIVELIMDHSKLGKLWEGIKLLPDLSTATNLLKLNMTYCSNLQELNLFYCSSLINLPSSIGNATNLADLDLSNCSNLLELPLSIGNLRKLQGLILRGCSKLELNWNSSFKSKRGERYAEMDLSWNHAHFSPPHDASSFFNQDHACFVVDTGFRDLHKEKQL